MTRISIGYFTAGLLDLLIASSIFCLPYAAGILGLGTLGTVANSLFGLVYVLVCLLVSRFPLFRELRAYSILGCFLLCAAAVLMFLAPSRVSIIFSALLSAAGAALFYPAIQSWITEGLPRPAIVRVMSGYSIAWVTGYLLGPLLSGIILASFGPEKIPSALRLVFGVEACLAVACLFFFTRRIPPAADIVRSEAESPRIGAAQKKVKFFIILLWVNNFAAFFVTGLIRFLFTELGKSEHLSPLVVGGVATLLYLVIIPCTLVLKHLKGWIFSFGWTIAFQVLAIPAVLFLAFTKSVPLYFAAAVLIGILSAFSFYASASYSLMYEGKQAAFININESVIGIGAFLSAGAGALLAETVGVKAGFLPGLAAVGLSLATQVILFLRFRRKLHAPGSSRKVDTGARSV
jgi:MFS family permease